MADEKNKKEKKVSYRAKDIYVLEGLEPVRKRPGMYIGSTGTDGLHHLIWECADNSFDEAMGGHCDKVEVTLLPGNRAKISDNGRGIPVDKHPQTKVSALETIMTTLHAGGKFGGESYKVAGGLHGVGVSVVNALSSWMKAEVCRDGGLYVQEYQRGKPKAKVKKIEVCSGTGTTVIFEPDKEIFKDIEFKWSRIITHLRQQAYLIRGLKVVVRDERKEPARSHTFYFDGGLVSYVGYLNKGEEVRHDNIFYVAKDCENIFVEVALQYTNDLQGYEIGFANNIHTPDGGAHLTGFRSALTRALNNYAKKSNILKNMKGNLSGDDVREGLTAVVSVKLGEPQFEGQTKAKLGNPEARTAVDTVVSAALEEYLEKNPQDAKAILERCVLSAKARQAAKAARETVIRKGVLEGMTLPGKLADCSSRKAEETEIYIVEGDSAGGCFDGKTKIALTDGRSLSFIGLKREEKKGKKNYCYTIKKDGSVGIERIKNVRKTKKNTEVIKIVLDNNEEIICTPNHRFMMRNREYKEARNLTSRDSLMPLYRKFSKKEERITIEGYEMVLNPKSDGKPQWTFTHLLADKYNLENGFYSMKKNSHKHHIDFNKLNNNPDNIEQIDRDDQRKKAYNKTYYKKTIEFLKMVYAKYGNLEKYDQLRIKNRNNCLLKFSTFCERFFNGDENITREAIKKYNHKIKRIIKLKKKIDTYDFEVEGTHNFALASGIFVHNSAKQGRDRRFQAILPLRGKILNVERARLDRALSSKEIRSLVIALGTAIADDFDLSKLRYHRVIIMTDADVDGAHIRTLLLTLFFRYFPEIITNGHLYIAQPPLYRLQKGKKVEYGYNDADKEEIFSAMGGEGVNIQRYKGLGEMNPRQLWETTMDPENRMMKQVMVEDAKEADRVFDILMGDEVPARRKFIQTHAKKVKNLDI